MLGWVFGSAAVYHCCAVLGGEVLWEVNHASGGVWRMNTGPTFGQNLWIHNTEAVHMLPKSCRYRAGPRPFAVSAGTWPSSPLPRLLHSPFESLS